MLYIIVTSTKPAEDFSSPYQHGTDLVTGQVVYIDADHVDAFANLADDDEARNWLGYAEMHGTAKKYHVIRPTIS